jgi:hypothetical protein
MINILLTLIVFGVTEMNSNAVEMRNTERNQASKKRNAEIVRESTREVIEAIERLRPHEKNTTGTSGTSDYRRQGSAGSSGP